MQCVMEGHQIVALANLKPENKGISSKWSYLNCINISMKVVEIHQTEIE